MKKNNMIMLLLPAIMLFACNAPRHDAVKAPHKIIKIEVSATGAYPGDTLVKKMKNAYINFYNNRLGILTDEGTYIQGSCKYLEPDNIWNIRIGAGENMLLSVSRHEEKEGKEWTILEGNTLSGTGVKIILEYDAYYQYESIDQLRPAENKWRIIPAASQSDKEIKAKVVGQLHYIRNYFLMLEERKDAYFNGKHLNAPFDFYSNGIGLKQPGYRTEWNGIFYDTTDARKGFELLEDAMNNIRTKLIKENTPSGIYNNILGQMLDYIEA